MTVQALRVRAVPFTLDCTNSRFVAEFHANVKVPVTVWFPARVNVSVFVAVQVRVSVVNILFPVIV